MLTALALASLLAAGNPGPAAAAAPGAAALPPGELGKVVRLGRSLFDETDTHPLTKPYVKNALTCASCHPDSGAGAAATLVGAATAYPAWSTREKAVITLEDRILNCFMRSMNGVRPPNGSPPSVALTAYVTWLSAGLPVAMNPRYPKGPRALAPLPVFADEVNVQRGRTVFEARCATCHGKDGDGNPPLWGPRSYNAGAGFADVEKLAAFVRATMPYGDPTLSDSEAVDVAAFVNAQPRPDFRLREHLPNGASYNSALRDELVRAPTWPPRE
ncbi:MAG TPA: c-type cytochrome [Anaeromyxobacteraceae bacterium]|jgi:thiosulfate dehydrogenase|nr:c-type cytochrome [Anaeromyxobacteraceae bacterium]